MKQTREQKTNVTQQVHVLLPQRTNVGLNNVRHISLQTMCIFCLHLQQPFVRMGRTSLVYVRGNFL